MSFIGSVSNLVGVKSFSVSITTAFDLFAHTSFYLFQ